MRLLFRNIIEADLQMIMEWRTNPDVSKYMFTDFKPDIEQQRAWFERIRGDDTQKQWVINCDNVDVGLASISNINPTHRRCDWAYYLGSASVRGKGIGKNIELNVLDYVFGSLKLNKLCGEIYLANEMVIGIHKKYGSRIEGTRRQHIFKDGRFHDVVEMGILREDWERNVKGRIEYTRAVIE